MFRGFIVHAYGDLRRDRLYFIGRLEDGRSFAVMESRWRPSVYVPQEVLTRQENLFSSLSYEKLPSKLEAFDGQAQGTYACLQFPRYRDRAQAVRILEQAGIPTPYGDMKFPDSFLAERYIKGPVEIRGASRPGQVVAAVFPNPVLSPLDSPMNVPLTIASVDIETDTRDGSILAIGLAVTDTRFKEPSGFVRVRSPEKTRMTSSEGRVLFHPDERSMLRAFMEDIRRVDPDVLTGWNFLDFDFKCLWDRCAWHRIPFTLGRSLDLEGVYLSGEGRSSAAALVPGRQVLDALRIVRSGPKVSGVHFTDYTLETVSQVVLGEGKLVSAAGTGKIAALAHLYSHDPVRFGAYCYQDAVLVLRILGQTGLFRLTVERSCLTGVSLDKAWTSVVSFERIYGMELLKRGIAPPQPAPEITVSGATGGTLLEPRPGFFSNVAVFDFRSLYPSIIRTFNIDPLSYARAKAAAPASGLIKAPNGAVFSSLPGLLPGLIEEYFAARKAALDRGDENAAYVYKILMNSFYGVLGTKACRYGRTELAGAITSFARKWLLFSRDWFTGQGFRVLYGDTDSLFVETRLGDGAAYQDFFVLCQGLAAELNALLAGRIDHEYHRASFMELRFEKAYRRFMIPPLRAFSESAGRGRAKGYGGYLLDASGTLSVEVKGMEAVRSDATPLARRLQMELLEMVFAGGREAELSEKVQETIGQLRRGELDEALIYRKRLSRPPETYTSSTPPQVKAARLLGWKGRRGTVAFVWTLKGPEPALLPHAPFDYDHYINAQVLPVARSIAAAALWDQDILFKGDPQMELF
ncbi:MAG: DNA polymerase II [Treponema sp.]|nr:DNA polymerase II [Treponema sp.]